MLPKDKCEIEPWVPRSSAKFMVRAACKSD